MFVKLLSDHREGGKYAAVLLLLGPFIFYLYFYALPLNLANSAKLGLAGQTLAPGGSVASENPVNYLTAQNLFAEWVRLMEISPTQFRGLNFSLYLILLLGITAWILRQSKSLFVLFFLVFSLGLNNKLIRYGTWLEGPLLYSILLLAVVWLLFAARLNSTHKPKRYSLLVIAGVCLGLLFFICVNSATIVFWCLAAWFWYDSACKRESVISALYLCVPIALLWGIRVFMEDSSISLSYFSAFLDVRFYQHIDFTFRTLWQVFFNKGTYFPLFSDLIFLLVGLFAVRQMFLNREQDHFSRKNLEEALFFGGICIISYFEFFFKKLNYLSILIPFFFLFVTSCLSFIRRRDWAENNLRFFLISCLMIHVLMAGVILYYHVNHWEKENSIADLRRWHKVLKKHLKPGDNICDPGFVFSGAPFVNTCGKTFSINRGKITLNKENAKLAFKLEDKPKLVVFGEDFTVVLKKILPQLSERFSKYLLRGTKKIYFAVPKENSHLLSDLVPDRGT